MPARPRATLQLPTGTVTFLFTDIEGSTRLWETRHAAMQVALAQHDVMLRAAIEGHGGYLVKNTGDGAVAAFAIAADAIAACLAVQRSLSTSGGDDFPIKSRMALHTGMADLRDGDYYGPALNRAARLMAAGHGGQILLSLATEELVRDHLPADVVLRDMGERRLKDLIRPERVFQVIAPDLRADFPPLKTLDARPNNLPAQATPFIGRENEIRAIKERLSKPDVRLLTLSGVGGTGKTRLALQAAADLVDEFEHGVFFVPLAALTDSALVLPTIAKAFDVRETTGRPLQDQLRDYLGQKQLLLVLDNFEQVIDAATSVSDLLGAAPRLKVLVTSREVLRLSGEADYPVPPLSLPDSKQLPPLNVLTQYEAVALFIERAVAVKPSFTVTNENAPAVAEICHRLDGLPLAIELAAARVRVLPPQRMQAQLSHRLSFLAGGARDLPARQKTLRSAIDWSHDLLAADERKLFRRLAVFVGGCTLEAIESVCNAEDDLAVFETVESLVDKSLVNETETHGEPRFAMLETIREYAGERLVAAGEDESVRDRHLGYFLALAEELEPKLAGAEQAMWLLSLDREHENLRAALAWSLAEGRSAGGLRLCGALQRFWWARGHYSEGREWCARVLASAGTEEPTLERARALSAAGSLAYLQGDFPAARALGEESLAIGRELGNRGAVSSKAVCARALYNLGQVASDQGDYLAARAMFHESLAISREVGSRFYMAAAMNALGILAYQEGDYSAATAMYHESLAIKRELGDRTGIAHSLNNLGNLAAAERDVASAQALYGESLAIMRELGHRKGIANALTNLAELAREHGDHAGARPLIEECLAIRRELADRPGIALVLQNLAEAIAALGAPGRAARIWGATERLREEIGLPLSPNDRSVWDQSVAKARATLGDYAAFDRAWQEGRALTLEQAIEVALERSVGRR